ncbi:MAG: type IX secretion system outer membrane channel protein PorV [Flavobacteriales bacterium]|nr:type IX secretion system outer membrane channel protein PorV [Flavobacteriales bacterium]
MKIKLFITLFLLLIISSSKAQISTQNLSGKNINTITTAVPFLMISPDSRSGAMGDVGVAIKPDVNSVYWNPAKLAFIDESKDMAFSMSYSPWLRALVNDINLAYLSGYKRLDRNSVVGASLRYFSLGSITFTDNFGGIIRDFKPNEFSFDVVYSRKLSAHLSAGLAARYIYSNLTGGTNVGGADTKPGQSAATDLSIYYVSNKFDISDRPSDITFGMNISNIGAKMAYTDNADRDFIPTNLRMGTALNMELDEYNEFSFSFDANKLLVPTQPVYQQANGAVVFGVDNLPIIYSGRDPNVGVASGIFGSFTDAPGNVTIDENGNTIGVEKGSKFVEELNEINLSVGAEYLYSHLFAVRAGYFHEHPTKGNRRYLSFGAGIKYKVLELDISYLLALTQQSPLANTLRFSIKFNMGSETEAAVTP